MFEDLGEYKNRFASILVNNDKICRLLLGENYETEIDDLDTELDKYIKQHLYIEDTITETKSYILFESNPSPTSPTLKNMNIIVQVICHKDIVRYKEKPKGYSGLRYDVLTRYIEEAICPKDETSKNAIIKKFGIGGFEIKSPGLFNQNNFVGRTFILSVPEFR